jgi:galactokinase
MCLFSSLLNKSSITLLKLLLGGRALTTGLLQRFSSVFGYDEGVKVSHAPGRVNLIGEHTDYNEGFVLPTPIDRNIWVLAAPRSDSRLRVNAFDLEDSIDININEVTYSRQHGWANYILGVIDTLHKKGFQLKGVDMVITGDVPREAGLGSSAALETAAIKAFQSISKIDIDPLQVAYIGKAVENEFVGVQSGVMDQFVASMGEHGKAMFIDCRTNEYKFTDLPRDYSVVIVNTMKMRDLRNSDYNERRQQCIEAVKILRSHDPSVTALRDVTPQLLVEHWMEMPEVVRMRARHVITENERVLNAVEFLRNGDVQGFGDLMYDSHESLRYDYEVSCRELDVLVDITLDMREVAGARMTGAGFGGCTVNLVEKDYLDKFVEAIKEQYFRYTAKKAEVYLA